MTNLAPIHALPPQNPRDARAAVKAAAGVLRIALDKLDAAERRESQARADRFLEAAAARQAQAAARAAEPTVSVSKKWLEGLMETALDALNAEKRAARDRREQRRADAIADQMDQLVAGYEKALGQRRS
jgi:hypothetical protein